MIHIAIGQCGSNLHNLLLVFLERGLERLPETDRLRRNNVHQRAALGAGEDGGVQLLGQLLVVGEQQAAPGAPAGTPAGEPKRRNVEN